MFLWMVLSSSSFYSFQLFSSNITRNGKSINSQRFHCQSFMPLCSVVRNSCRSTLEGVFPLETPPPSGRAPSPPTDSVSQWLWILPGISWQKKKQERHFKFSRGVVRYHQNGASLDGLFYNAAQFDAWESQQVCVRVSVSPYLCQRKYTP